MMCGLWGYEGILEGEISICIGVGVHNPTSETLTNDYDCAGRECFDECVKMNENE
jgi:hypothetical protein